MMKLLISLTLFVLLRLHAASTEDTPAPTEPDTSNTDSILDDEAMALSSLYPPELSAEDAIDGDDMDEYFDEFPDDEEELGDDEFTADKRGLQMLRLGKRPMHMLRLGKRPMHMLRLGKRPMHMLRLGKRPMHMLRLGKRPMHMLRLGKRPMHMLRLGKRPMHMLRLGKRPMHMLRLGKRPMHMLRLGKRPDSEM